MPNLLSLPNEILAEVAKHLKYEDSQELRLVCHRIDTAVQHVALSRVQLHWRQEDTDTHHFRIPVSKIQAYSTAHSTLGVQYVRHLTLGDICVKFYGRKSSLDRIVGPSEADLESFYGKTEKRKRAFDWLLENFLLGKGMENLETLRWFILPCHAHKHWAGLPPSDGDREACEKVLERVSELLTQRGPALRQVEMILGPGCALTRPLGNLSSVPPCKELVIRGLSDIIWNQNTPSYPWVGKVISGCASLEFVDMDLCFNKARLALFFPPTDDRTIKPQYTNLLLNISDYRLDPRIVNHFRSLRRLEIHGPLGYSDDDDELGLSSFWRLLSSEKIYVEEIVVYMGDAEDEFVQYLASYPRPTLKTLEFRRLKPGSQDSFIWELESPPELVMSFFLTALPAVAPGLEELSIPSYYLSPWCFGPNTLQAFQACISLRRLVLSMDTQFRGKEFEQILHRAFERHYYLQSVHVIEIIDDYASTPKKRWKEYTINFGRQCLKLAWGGECSIHHTHHKRSSVAGVDS